MIKSLGFIPMAGFIGKLDAEGAVKHTSLPIIKTDVLVVGGGTAGVIAAIQAARAGCRTTLLECGSQLGGTMTTGGVSFPGLFHAWGRQVIGGIGWELVSEAVRLNGDEMPDFTIPFGTSHSKHQIPINAPLYSLLAEEKCLQAGVAIRYYETPLNINMINSGWRVEVVGKGTHIFVDCRQLVDCTGNASVTDLAGYRRVREKESQPGSLIFQLEGYDVSSLDFDDINRRFEDALAKGKIFKTDAYNGIRATLTAMPGTATEHVPKADSSTSELHTLANIEGRKSLLRILRFVRTLPGCENARIKLMNPETAIRETYRIEGEYKITCDDYVSGSLFDDSVSYSYYPIDLHDENGVRPKHLEEGVVATIPLRALIPKGSRNIIVAGRCVSSDRLANSALRVQASCMGMGQAAGAAAAIAFKKNTTPLDIPIKELKDLLRKNGGIVPE
jgi:hypothetical protein